jgi:hypothetical protein
LKPEAAQGKEERPETGWFPGVPGMSRKVSAAGPLPGLCLRHCRLSYRAAAQATGADLDPAVPRRGLGADLLQIGLEAPLGLVVGVADVISNTWLLAADLALLGHESTSFILIVALCDREPERSHSFPPPAGQLREHFRDARSGLREKALPSPGPKRKARMVTSSGKNDKTKSLTTN